MSHTHTCADCLALRKVVDRFRGALEDIADPSARDSLIHWEPWNAIRDMQQTAEKALGRGDE